VRYLLGMGYMNLEGYDKSERELEAALELYRGSLGEDHEATREVLEDLAFLYLIVGRETDREEALRAIVGIHSRTQGEEHPETLAATASLADNLISQGKLGDGEELTSRTYAAQRRVLGETHDDTLGTRGLQGRIHFARGEMAEAEQISREVLEGYRDLNGSEHASTRLATGDLASTLLAQGKVDEARQLYETRAVPDPLGVEMWFQGGDPDGAGGDRADTQMLVFWETWCPFSQRVVPELERVHRRFQDQDFELVGMTAVRRSATDEKVREFIAAKEITYPIGKEDGRASDVLAVRGTPWVSLVSDGALVWEGYLQTPEEMSGKMIDGLMRARED
jgi:thiol-disulfide isomerase/thioredoxin